MSDRLTRLEKAFDNFRIVTQDGITAHGSMHTGYAIHVPGNTQVPPPGLPGPVPPPGGGEPTGACCHTSGDCTIETEANCDSMGGDYQGDDIACDEVECLVIPTGACCDGEGGCSVQTEIACSDAGGNYAGDGTTCDDGGGEICTVTCGGCYYNGDCGGNPGYESGEGCYCTLNDSGEYSCSVFFPSDGTTYSRSLVFSYTTVYGFHDSGFGCVQGIISSTCDSCTLTRNFRDGSSTSCDCCSPGCAAGFCSDAGGGGIDCPCDLEVTGDTMQHCEEDLTSIDGNAHCNSSETVTLS